MTAFNEKSLNNLDENLRTIRQNDNMNAEELGGNTSSGALENDNPFAIAEDPMKKGVESQTDDEQFDNEEFGENSDLFRSNIMNNNSVTPGPDDDDLEDDDDDLDLDDDDTLIPIEGDDDDDLLDTDIDDDIVPGTDMDDDDLIDDDDDDTDDTSVNRSTTSGMGSNVSSRDHGRDTGRMIDHEPGTGSI